MLKFIVGVILVILIILRLPSETLGFKSQYYLDRIISISIIIFFVLQLLN
uniref:Preprotein-translocase subunit g n=1 Tax=Climaconeis sp. TaxID=2846830 RepID=A0A8F8SPD1_9STRA|nr:preprotein-translocase subunit g [Climaconeis sp.]